MECPCVCRELVLGNHSTGCVIPTHTAFHTELYHLFHTDKVTGKIICLKCNRVYYGGYDELVNLNQRRIDDELQLVVEDVKKDLQKELMKGLKIK